MSSPRESRPLAWRRGSSRAGGRALIAAAVAVLVATVTVGCEGDSDPRGVAPARSLDELVSRYYDALAASDARTVCALTNPESITQYERDAGKTCEAYFDELTQSWGPATRKLVGEIEIGGDPGYTKNEQTSWQAFDPKAPLIIDRPETEIRALLGDEFKDVDRSSKIQEVRTRAEKQEPADPEALTVFETYGFNHPTALSLISYVGAIMQYADNLNSENPGERPHWVMGKVRGVDLLGRHMVH